MLQVVGDIAHPRLLIAAKNKTHRMAQVRTAIKPEFQAIQRREQRSLIVRGAASNKHAILASKAERIEIPTLPSGNHINMADNANLLPAFAWQIGKTGIPTSIMRLQPHALGNGKRFVKRRTRPRTERRTECRVLGIKRAINGNQALGVGQKCRPLLCNKCLDVFLGCPHSAPLSP